MSAACFAVVTPMNNLVRDEPINLEKALIGVIFVFVLFGLIGMLTDKLESEVGDA